MRFVPSALSNPTLSAGSKGPEVLELRKLLALTGYPTQADGASGDTFGAALTAAVRSFQAKNGLKADGVAGSQTISTLFQKMSPEAGKSHAPKLFAASQVAAIVSAYPASTSPVPAPEPSSFPTWIFPAGLIALGGSIVAYALYTSSTSSQ